MKKNKKMTLALLGVISFTLGAIGAFSNEKRLHETVTVMNATNWGLSFQEKNQCPVIDIDEATLQDNEAYYLGNEDDKKIYITFDAGYENGYTEKILDSLKKHNVKACFFLVGNYLEKCPDIVKRMEEEGHIVANHTYNHKDMATLTTKEEFLKELTSLEDLYKEITGKEMKKYYRPPQGKFCTAQMTWAKEQGYKTIFWSLAYVDWEVENQPSKEEAISILTERIHPGAIVLLHSTSETNGNILDELITKWKNMGYTFGTLEEF